MIKTPYYLIDKTKLLSNMEKIAYVREHSGAKALLALKCFATWSVFDLMQQYMDGTTSSSLFELKLGRQKFAGETHAYSVAWADDEVEEMLENCDKIIFNSIGQLERFAEQSEGKVRGLRVNPQVSSSDYLLADPARPFSRLGEWDPVKIEGDREDLRLHVPQQLRERRLRPVRQDAQHIEERFGHLLHKVEWVSLGGGIHFTGEDYAVDAFCARLKRSRKPTACRCTWSRAKRRSPTAPRWK
jgi:carboxynorspermidine decarboxylase